MKKIMFNDKYGLTQAVLDGRKTQTRRIITHPKTFHGKDVCGFYVYKRVTDGVITEACMYDENEISIDEGQILPKYMVGEVVAVAQSMCDVYAEWDMIHSGKDTKSLMKKFGGSPCFNNKMFVRASEMPHQIRITNVQLQKLQDISDEDCSKEGIIKKWHAPACKDYYYVPGIEVKSVEDVHDTPQEAFAQLIDKVSGKGTWDSNPYVWVYDFELIKR